MTLLLKVYSLSPRQEHERTTTSLHVSMRAISLRENDFLLNQYDVIKTACDYFLCFLSCDLLFVDSQSCQYAGRIVTIHDLWYANPLEEREKLRKEKREKSEGVLIQF